MYRRGSVSLDPGSAPLPRSQRGQGKRKTNVQGFLRSEESWDEIAITPPPHHSPRTPTQAAWGAGHSRRRVLVALQHQRQLVGENLHQLG